MQTGDPAKTRIHDKLIPHFEEDHSHAISLTRWLQNTEAVTNAGQQKVRREKTCHNSVGDWQTQDFSGQHARPLSLLWA